MKRGVSLLEVLIAIFIITLGILGVASLLPLGAHLAKKGLEADRAANAGKAAMSEFAVRDMGNPDAWFYADGSKVSADFTNSASPLNPTAPMAWCLDPRLVSRDNTAGTFPAHGSGPTMPRLNFWDGQYTNPGGVTGRYTAMATPMADYTFSVHDDLLFEVDESDATKPPTQLMASGQRFAERRNSWMATLVRESPGDRYTLSIVVFDGRFNPAKADESPLDVTLYGGIGGGEVAVTGAASANIKPGEWLMLANGTRFGWYRIQSAAEPTASPRELTLQGGDWNGATATATYMPGVMSVYERSIRLEPHTLWTY